MKKLFILAFLLVGTDAIAQTPTEALAAFNSGVCSAITLPANCSDAQALAAWCVAKSISPCVDGRAADNKVYATVTGWNNAVVIPERQKEWFDRRRNEEIAKLVKRILLSPAICTSVMTAASLDVSVCK